jgi:hypothetical protein
LGNNIFTIAKSKQFLVLDMLTNFGIISIPFLHINPNIFVKLQKESCLLANNVFFFHSITNF